MQASTHNGLTDYLYNGHSERVLKRGSKSARSGPYFYVYNPSGQLVGEYIQKQGSQQSANWEIEQETVWLEDISVAAVKPGNKLT